jgi:hypothetical protein
MGRADVRKYGLPHLEISASYGCYEHTAKFVAAQLGISETTVLRDRWLMDRQGGAHAKSA